MAEIKFTTARMIEVRSRLDEMATQLSSTISEDSGYLNQIASNIQSDNISSTLKQYADAAVTTGRDIITLIGQLDEYLAVQIGSYQATDVSAQDAISEVQGILNQF